jgi:two-component system, NarL family, response regulator YdfI
VIRVLIASRSAELEDSVRASASLEFAGRVDPSLTSAEYSGDVLLIELDGAVEHDWHALAELPISVIILVHAPDPAFINSVLRSGVRGAIHSDATPQEIESAVHAVNAGLVVTVPDFLPRAEELREPLSDRELEVLDLLSEGLSNKLIAHRLGISEHTVKTHVASIFVKLGATSRTEAVSQAIRRGLVML